MAQGTMVIAGIGEAPNNHLKNQRGMDEIDRWAEQTAAAERQHKSFTVHRAGKGNKMLNRRAYQV